MIAGFAGQERERRVIGIDGSARPSETREQVARIPVRPIFVKHQRCRDPRWEASMLARYYYEKSEAGKMGYGRVDEIEV